MAGADRCKYGKGRGSGVMNRGLRLKIVEHFGSQIAFAHRLKIDPGLVSRIVRGWRALSEKEQIRWAKALDSTPEELFKEQ